MPAFARPTRADVSPAPLRIGDLAERTGVSVDALRYYERRGLVRPIGRRASGYREYPPEAVGVVRFVKRAQALGFSLAEVEELLRLRGDAGRVETALAARDVARAKIRDIDERVRQLIALRDGLADLVDACEVACEATEPPLVIACPIIGALDDDGTPADPPGAVPTRGVYAPAPRGHQYDGQ
jgi:DNA-binding transcriptional MerR regulator